MALGEGGAREVLGCADGRPQGGRQGSPGKLLWPKPRQARRRDPGCPALTELRCAPHPRRRDGQGQNTPTRVPKGSRKTLLTVSGCLIWATPATGLHRPDAGPLRGSPSARGAGRSPACLSHPRNPGTGRGGQVRGAKCRLGSWRQLSQSRRQDLGHVGQLLRALFPSVTEGALALDGRGGQVPSSP